MNRDPDQHLKKAKKIVVEHYNQALSEVEALTTDDVYIVWFSKALQNWKALLSTNRPDNAYYEVTYNGDKKETYVDLYLKASNVVVKDE